MNAKDRKPAGAEVVSAGGRRRARSSVVALAVFVLATLSMPSVGTASAAGLSGSVNDPRDAPVDPGTRTRGADVRAVMAWYDRAGGELVLQIDFWGALRQTPERFAAAQVSLSVAGNGGNCDPDRVDAWVYVDASRTPDDRRTTAFLEFAPSSGQEGILEPAAVRTWRGDRRIVARFARSELERNDFRCVDHIRVGYDEVDGFRLQAGGSVVGRAGDAFRVIPWGPFR